MEQVTLGDGLVVTVSAMIVVFAVLASLWFLTELVHKLLPDRSGLDKPAVVPIKSEHRQESQELPLDPKKLQVVKLTALIAAHSESPAKKYEIVDVRRVK